MSNQCDQTYVTKADFGWSNRQVGLCFKLIMIWLVNPWNLWEAKLYWISLLSIGLMISMICKSAMLLAHHGSCISMDQFVMMVKELVLLLFLWMVLFLSSQTDRKRIAQIIKLSMKRFYLAWNFYNLWAWSMLKPLVIHFWRCSKYSRYANDAMDI